MCGLVCTVGACEGGFWTLPITGCLVAEKLRVGVSASEKKNTKKSVTLLLLLLVAAW